MSRDQGKRPTCVAFAVSDAHLVARGGVEPLSVEHLFYNAVLRSAKPNPKAGVTLTTILGALRDDGQCQENRWPYLDCLPLDLTAWVPPANVQPVFMHGSEIRSTNVDTIVEDLDDDRPSIITLLLGERFYKPISGVIDIGPNDNDTAYHAVIGVGHGKHAAGRAIIVRNSWGESWGENGYAWVTEAYLRSRLRHVARLI